MTYSNIQKTDNYIAHGLSVSLLLYALVCPISRSANYFPLASLSLFALYLRVKGNDSFPVSNSLMRLAGIWLSLVVWRCVTIFVNGGGISFSPILKTFNILPLFLLYRLPCEEGWKRERAVNALFVLLSVAALTVILGLFQKVTDIAYPLPVQPFTDGKLEGFLGGHIHAGGFYSVLAIVSLCLILFWRTSNRSKMILAGLLLVLTTGVMFSLSRTYYISLLVTLPFIFVRKNLKATVIGVVLMLSLIWTVLSFSPTIKDRALSIVDVKKNPSNVERIYLWKVARDIILDKPVTGIGFKRWGNNLYVYEGRYAGEWEFSPAAFHHAHNVYLSVAAETGVVGLALFLGFWLYLLYLMFWMAGDVSRDGFDTALARGTSFGLLNLLIGGMFEENFGSTAVNLFLISFLISLTFFVSNTGMKGNMKSLTCYALPESSDRK